MTREEAIEILNREYIKPFDGDVWVIFPEVKEALDMAIKALERIDKIEHIIAVDNSVIQEDVLKYKMICEVLK